MLRFWANGNEQALSQLRRRILWVRCQRLLTIDRQRAKTLRDLEARYAAALKQQLYKLHLRFKY